MIRSPLGLAPVSGHTTLPVESVTLTIVWRGIRTPPFAIAP